jgi:hypothetical protein
MLELEYAADKPLDRSRQATNEPSRVLEDREFLVLTYLQALANYGKTGVYDLHATMKAAIKSLGLISSR